MANRIIQTALKLRKLLRKYRRELLLGILVSSVFTASWFTLTEQKKMQELIDRRSEEEQKLEDLRSLITQFPDSRDLLYRQALLEWELGNDEAASGAIERARYLDPNSPVLPTLDSLEIQHSLE